MFQAHEACPLCGQEHAADCPCHAIAKDLAGATGPAIAIAAATPPVSWLHVGDEIEFVVLAHDSQGLELPGDVRLCVRLSEMLDRSPSRRVFTARLSTVLFAQAEHTGELVDPALVRSLERQTYLVEERLSATTDWAAMPEAIQSLVRRPLTRLVRGERPVSIYLDNAGMTLDEIMDLHQGRLSYGEVRDIFSAVLDAMAKLHAAGLLHLRLAPWNLRIVDLKAAQGPSAGLAETSADNLAAVSDDPGEVVPDPRGLVEDTMTEFGEGGEAQADDGFPGEGVFESAERTEEAMGFDDMTEGYQEEDSGGMSLESRRAQTTMVLRREETPAGQSRPVQALKGPRYRAIFDGISAFIQPQEDFGDRPATVGFSAPELLVRSQADMGFCSDIFTLGMLLYYLIAGRQPPASVYTRFAPAVPARNFNPSFPPGLDGVVRRATRPNPTERFASVEELARAFESARSILEARITGAIGPAPVIDLAVDTHVGIAKGRRNPVNQDSVFAASSEDGHYAMIVVADGVSTASYGSGDLASLALSRSAAQAWDGMLAAYEQGPFVDDAEHIQCIVDTANAVIIDYINARFHPFQGQPHEVMGSTALVVVYRKGVVTMGTLGDSRVYLQRGESLEQLTIDHNVWTLSILDGVIADVALAMPHGDALARCLGAFTVEHGELVRQVVQPDMFRFSVAAGDRLLVTTDGLLDFAGANPLESEDLIATVLQEEEEPALACLELILLANRGGGGDNIGVGVARFI